MSTTVDMLNDGTETEIRLAVARFQPEQFPDHFRPQHFAGVVVEELSGWGLDVRVDENDQVAPGDHGDRREILDRIVGKLFERIGVHDKCSSVSGRLYILATPAAGFANPDPSHYTGTACFGSPDKIQREPSHRDRWLALGAFRHKSWA